MTFDEPTLRTPSRREFLAFGIGTFVATLPFATRRRPRLTRRALPVMGTIAQFAVVHQDEYQAHGAIDAAFAELQWVETVMTRFTDISDIGRANRGAARDSVAITRETAQVVREALRWSQALDGRYDPAVGAVVQLWDVKNRHEPPPDAQIAELAGRRFYRGVEVGSSGGGSVLRYHDRGIRLDLGSIGKGYGVDRAVAALRRHGVTRAVVVAGGDLYALGHGPDGDPWTIGIQSPDDERTLAGSIPLADRAVATSGTYRQFFRYRGRTYHHIMDPWTAAPRTTSMRSLSITAESVMHADAATTALFGLAADQIAGALKRNLPDGRLVRIL